MRTDLPTIVRSDPWSIEGREFPASADLAEQATFLVGYAILAPSTKNTQPWRFQVNGGEVGIWRDTSRWLRVADRGQRELHLSLGCALENLLVAAEYFGRSHEVTLWPRGESYDLAAVVRFGPGEAPDPRREGLGPDAILRRRTAPGPYVVREIPSDILTQLEVAAVEDGVVLHLTNDAEVRRAMDNLSCRADARLFADHAFREELGFWASRGAFSMPWLISRIVLARNLFGRRCARAISASGTAWPRGCAARNTSPSRAYSLSFVSLMERSGQWGSAYSPIESRR
jgi:hypothetical protein